MKCKVVYSLLLSYHSTIVDTRNYVVSTPPIIFIDTWHSYDSEESKSFFDGYCDIYCQKCCNFGFKLPRPIHSKAKIEYFVSFILRIGWLLGK